jgi:hypothetical protein
MAVVFWAAAGVLFALGAGVSEEVIEVYPMRCASHLKPTSPQMTPIGGHPTAVTPAPSCKNDGCSLKKGQIRQHQETAWDLSQCHSPCHAGLNTVGHTQCSTTLTGKIMNQYKVAIGIIVAIVAVSVYLGVTDDGPSEHFTSGANVLAR